MPRWWGERLRLARLTSDLLHSELVRSRRSDAGIPPPPWPMGLRLDADLRADSLDRMSLATALAEAIQLHRSGIEDALLARRGFAEWLDVAEAGLGAHDAELTFRTSGSTGTPRACSHSLARLEQEVDFLATLVGDRRRVIRVVPCHHIYGFLFTILLPAKLGIRESDVLDARDASPGGVTQRVAPGDLVIGHPDFWRALLQSGARWPDGAAAVTSTAPCPAEVANGMAALGAAPFLQVYGASETAGVGWRVEASAPFELMPFWRREGERLMRREPGGDETSATLADDLSWHDERHFSVRARKDEAVQVGGINVYPAAVRRILLEHPGVGDAAVRLMRPEEGNRLKAFIVPRADAADVGALERSLREWIDERLATAERPKALAFGRALAATATGKLSDWDA